MTSSATPALPEGVRVIYIDRGGHRQAARIADAPKDWRSAGSVYIKVEGSPAPPFEARIASYLGQPNAVEISREALAAGDAKQAGSAEADRRRRDLVSRFLTSPEAAAGRSLAPAGGTGSLIPSRDQQRELEELARQYGSMVAPAMIPYLARFLANNPKLKPPTSRWEPEAPPVQAPLDESDTPGRIERYARRRGLIGSSTPERIVIEYARDKALGRLDD